METPNELPYGNSMTDYEAEIARLRDVRVEAPL